MSGAKRNEAANERLGIFDIDLCVDLIMNVVVLFVFLFRLTTVDSDVHPDVAYAFPNMWVN